MPSSCRHSRATSNWFSSVSVQPVPAAAARSESSATDATSRRVESSRSAPVGTGNGSRARTFSPPTRSGSWLVTRTLTSGPARATWPISGATSIRCSRLSSTEERAAGAQMIEDALVRVDPRDLGQSHRP